MERESRNSDWMLFSRVGFVLTTDCICGQDDMDSPATDDFVYGKPANAANLKPPILNT